MSKYVQMIWHLLDEANHTGPQISEKEAGDLLEQELRLLADKQFVEQIWRDEDVKRLLDDQVKGGRCTQKDADDYFNGKGRIIGLCWGGAQEKRIRALFSQYLTEEQLKDQQVFLGKITYDVDNAIRANGLRTAAAVRRYARALTGHERRHWCQPEEIIDTVSKNFSGINEDGTFTRAYYDRPEELDADCHGLRAMMVYITDVED